MTAPSARLREQVYRRDLFRCVACGTSDGLSFQHREASGHGGRGKKAPPLNPADGLAMCLLDNQRCESDMQELALASGWKLRRNRGGIPAYELPYRDAITGLWWLPDVEGFRHQVTAREAFSRLVRAGSVAA